MLELLFIKKFIYSAKNLKDYVKKLTSLQLTSLLNDFNELNERKKSKSDKNPLVRSLKGNLSEQDYNTLIGKLEIFAFEDQVFTLTKKEITLHFLGILAAILLASFSGFVGLLTALGMVISIEILGVLILTVFAISLLIAAIWSYQVRVSNQEDRENIKLLNFEIEILKTFNANKINRFLSILTILNQKLNLKSHNIDHKNLKDTQITPVILNNLRDILQTLEKETSPSSLSSSSASRACPEEIERNKNACKKKLTELIALLTQRNIDRTFEIIRYSDNPLDNPNFTTWFKTDTSRILFKLFNQSKNLLASVALGAVLGLVTLKLLAEVTILTALLTTYLGIGIVVGIIVIVVLSSMIFSVYDMYKHSKRTRIKNNTLAIIKEEREIKEQLENIEKELEQLAPLLNITPERLSLTAHDSMFMEEILEKDETENSKLMMLKNLVNNKGLIFPPNLENLATKNPLLILKLTKKINDNIISTDEEMNIFLQKFTTTRAMESKSLRGLSHEQRPTSASEDAFNSSKTSLNSLTDQQLLEATQFIERQTYPEEAYQFAQDNALFINNIAIEIAQRLSQQDIANNTNSLNLRKELENYKSMRKKVLAILIKENLKLQISFRDYVDALKKHPPTLSFASNNEEKQMEEIEKSLHFDSHTVTINQLIDKKREAASAYQTKSTLATEKNCFNFWQKPYQQNQKLQETFEEVGINFTQQPVSLSA